MGLFNRLPSNFETIGVIERSGVDSDDLAVEVLHHPHRSIVGAWAMPLGPMKESGGAVDVPPAFSMSTVTLPSGVTERTTLPCTSLNQSVPSGRHSGPSVNLKPPATFSMTAAGATSASNAGSSRVIAPTAVVAAGAVAAAGGGADAAWLCPLHPVADSSPATIAHQLLRFRATLGLVIHTHLVSS